jgi:hypothetical protein
MTNNDEDLFDTINDIESTSELKSIEQHNEIQQKWRDQVRKRFILMWLPIIALAIILIVWVISAIPSYDKCYKKCMKDSKLATMQKQDDCDFICHVRNQ